MRRSGAVFVQNPHLESATVNTKRTGCLVFWKYRIDINTDGPVCCDRPIVVGDVDGDCHDIGFVFRPKGEGDQFRAGISWQRVKCSDPAYKSPSCETRVARTDRRVDFKGNTQRVPFKHLKRRLNAHQAHHRQILSDRPVVRLQGQSCNCNAEGQDDSPEMKEPKRPQQFW